MVFEVVLSERSLDDLFAIWRYIAESSGSLRADEVDERLRAACLRLADFPHRGTPRDDLEPGLRSIPLRRHATIYYRITDTWVEIVRVLYAGSDALQEFKGQSGLRLHEPVTPPPSATPQ